MFRRCLHSCKILYDRCVEQYFVYCSKRREKEKFKDPKRVSIYEKVEMGFIA